MWKNGISPPAYKEIALKPKEIQIGCCYSNGSGRVRHVMTAGPQFVAYPTQEDRDCLVYVAITPEGRGKGGARRITRRRFASWAKQSVQCAHAWSE